MTYEIIDNIEMPRSSRRKYPFDELEVGQGFEFKDEKVRSAAYNYGKRCGKKFQTCKVGSVFRVKRIA